MKTFIFLMVFGSVSLICQAQSIVGRWQLIKQSNCVESELGEEEASTQEMVEDMKGLSGAGTTGFRAQREQHRRREHENHQQEKIL